MNLFQTNITTTGNGGKMEKNPCSGRCKGCPNEQKCELLPLTEGQRIMLALASFVLLCVIGVGAIICLGFIIKYTLGFLG
jgi:hypothetical protein